MLVLEAAKQHENNHSYDKLYGRKSKMQNCRKAMNDGMSRKRG